MGGITNQWLKGRSRLKNRPHSPESVTVTARPTGQDRWARQNKATTEIVATKADGTYQAIYLTQDEINKALPAFVAASDQPTQVQEAIKVLSALPDDELLKALAKVLGKRPASAPTL